MTMKNSIIIMITINWDDNKMHFIFTFQDLDGMKMDYYVNTIQIQDIKVAMVMIHEKSNIYIKIIYLLFFIITK